MTIKKILCNIILLIDDRLCLLKECIASIVEHTPEQLYHLYLIDKQCDSNTTEHLQTIANDRKNITLVSSHQSIDIFKPGKISNTEECTSFIILLKSDVLVVPNWLERLISCAESDPMIASVNPLINHSTNCDVPLSPGTNFLSMDWYISSISKRTYPDVTPDFEFCILVRCSALTEACFSSETHEFNLFEELEKNVRLTKTSEHRNVVADDVYVFHSGFSGHFIRKNKDNPVQYILNSVNPSKRWSPEKCMRETYRAARAQYRDHDYLSALKSSLLGLLELPYSTQHVANLEHTDQFTRPNRLRVTYVLHKITVAGGVISVVQLVNELILLGVEARIVSLYQYPETNLWKCYTAPIIFKDIADLVANFPESDIAVATHWSTAEWVSNVTTHGRAKIGVYFLQDYESWFFPKSDKTSRAAVKHSYTLIRRKIVKSSWLQQLIEKDGYDSFKIWLGLDLSAFYPRDTTHNQEITIIAMARPGTPRRGFPTLVKSLSLIKNDFPSTNIILFGEDLAQYEFPFEFLNIGVVSDQNQMATLYSQADIFIDSSDFQGFGRAALEAMACKTACILTEVGGVTEYAKNRVNCLLVPPKNPESIYQAFLDLNSDINFRSRIISGAMSTSRNFCHKQEARNTLKYFQSIIQINIADTTNPCRFPQS